MVDGGAETSSLSFGRKQGIVAKPHALSKTGLGEIGSLRAKVGTGAESGRPNKKQPWFWLGAVSRKSG